MQLNSLEDLFVVELKDLYSAEKQLLKAIPKMAKAANSKPLQNGFTKHLKQTEGHVSRLEKVFEELGVAAQTVLVAFGITFGAVMLGLAIAFGSGGQDLARRFLERRFVRGSKGEESEDELSPL